MKYIIVYQVHDYPGMGGGTYYQEFDTPELLDKKVSEVMGNKDHSLTIAGEFNAYEYKAVEYVTKIERQ